MRDLREFGKNLLEAASDRLIKGGEMICLSSRDIYAILEMFVPKRFCVYCGFPEDDGRCQCDLPYCVTAKELKVRGLDLWCAKCGDRIKQEAIVSGEVFCEKCENDELVVYPTTASETQEV